jgi:hypothetical protein
MAKRTLQAALVLGLVLAPLYAKAAAADDPWAPYRWLIGDWVGEGTGGPGQGSGGFTFALELQDKVIVRKNHADYPAQGSRPAFRHDDLMVIERPEQGTAKATYWDSEGHVIHYRLSPSADGTATFLSDTSERGPRYRLAYTRGDALTVAIKFEIAPPGKPEAFKTYIEARARRKAG